MAYLYLFPRTRRQSTAVGVSDSRRSVDPLSSCWPRMHRNTVRCLRSYAPTRITAATQPIRAQRLHRLLTKRSNHDPETLRTTVANGVCKVHFLLIKTTNYWTLTNSPVAFWLFVFLHRSPCDFSFCLWLWIHPFWLKYWCRCFAMTLLVRYVLFSWVTCCNIDYVNVFTDQLEKSPPWGETRCFKRTFMITGWLLFNDVGIAVIPVRIKCYVVTFSELWLKISMERIWFHLIQCFSEHLDWLNVIAGLRLCLLTDGCSKYDFIIIPSTWTDLSIVKYCVNI